jgi:hypothetical protein
MPYGDGRHRPGTLFVCDARRFGGDQHLCPLHAAAESMAVVLDEIHKLAKQSGDTRSMDIAFLARTALTPAIRQAMMEE